MSSRAHIAMVVSITLVLAGCASGMNAAPHRVPPPSASSDTGGTVIPDAGSQTAAQADLGPGVDAHSSVHYFGNPGKASGDFVTPGPGTWQNSGGSLCKVANDDGESVAVLKSGLISVADYTVETRFVINSVGQTLDEGWADAGLALRVDASGQSFYQCIIDLEGRRLVLGSLLNGVWTEIASSAEDSVAATGPYKIRAMAQGSQLTCQLVPGPTITAADTDLDSGSCGFSTFFSSACFEYLLVTDAP